MKKSILLLAALLTACSAQPQPPLLAQLPAEVSSAYQVHLSGSGGADVAVRILPAATRTPGFGLKNSTGGADAKAVSDIQAYRVFLVSAPGTLPSSVTPYNSTIVTITSNSMANQTIVFSDVPAGSYYACAAAFDSSSVFNSSTNITEDLGALHSYSEGAAACSTSGGDLTFQGMVKVDSNWQLLTGGVVGINLTLRGVRGATIDTAVTVQDG